MSQSDLAAATGLSLKTIGNYERGRDLEPHSPIPDGYYDVANALHWTPGSIAKVLAGGQPDLINGAPVSESELTDLITPAFRLADRARDLGAPSEMVDRFRMAAIELSGWLSHSDGGDGRAIAPSFTSLGPGVEPGDAERLFGRMERGQ